MKSIEALMFIVMTRRRWSFRSCSQYYKEPI